MIAVHHLMNPKFGNRRIWREEMKHSGAEVYVQWDPLKCDITKSGQTSLGQGDPIKWSLLPYLAW